MNDYKMTRVNMSVGVLKFVAAVALAIVYKGNTGAVVAIVNKLWDSFADEMKP